MAGWRDEVLDLLGTTNHRGLFVLGSSERRVTIFSQQCRALNLVEALHGTGRITEGTRVAVVGGGIGGATAAAAAAVTGAHVTIIERATELMHAQSGSHTRWIHPHLYDWPAPGWDNPAAGLPVMDWSAAYAGEVVKQLRAGWITIAEATELRVLTGATLVDVQAVDKQPIRLSWNAPGFDSSEYDVVVLAVGFGEEVESAHSHSYWHDDDLHQVSDLSVLISGVGDGGLADTLRVAVTGFEQHELADILSGPWVEHVRDEILRVESDPDLDPSQVTEFYLHKLNAGELTNRLRDRVERLAKVVLNGRTAAPLAHGASPLHHVLVAQLMRLGLAYEPGVLEHVHRDGARLAVVMRRLDGRLVEQEFDRVVQRHGATESPLAAFPAIEPRLTPEIAKRLTYATDRTRHPHWPDGAFAFDRVKVRKVPADAGAAVTSWVRIDGDELAALAAVDWSHRLLEYFDGRDPEWGDVVLGRIPRFEVVDRLASDVTERMALPGPGTITRIGGPSGEGKSTVLMQLVISLLDGSEPPAVFWRATSQRDIPWDLMEAAPSDQPLLLVSDRAHELRLLVERGLASQRFRTLVAERQAPIHIILAASDIDWNARGGGVLRSDKSGLEAFPSFSIRGLSSHDALALVAAMEASADPERALGELRRYNSTRERADALLASARERIADHKPGALLGALLEQRTGRGLEDHVRALMERLCASNVPSGHDLLTLYLHVGALQFHGLGAIDRDTLAKASDIRLTSVQPLIEQTLSSEITVTSVDSVPAYRIRHDAIARTVFDIAATTPKFQTTLADVLYDTVRAVVARNPQGWRDSRLREVFFLAGRLLKDEHPVLAVSAAKGAFAGAPDNLYLAINLAWTYREGLRPGVGTALGITLLTDAVQRVDDFSPETRGALRRGLRELAAEVGVSGQTVESAAENLCLALASISDAYEADRLSPEEVHLGLSQAGRALMDLAERSELWPAAQELPSIIALGRRANMPARKYHLDRFRKAAGNAKVPTPQIALARLSSMYEAAWAAVPPGGPARTLGLEPAGFELLRSHLHIPSGE